MAYHAGAEDHADVGEGEDDLLALEAARRQAEDAELVLLRRAADAVGRSLAALSRASLTCWSVTCSCSLATSCGIAERIPIGPSSDAMTCRERSC